MTKVAPRPRPVPSSRCRPCQATVDAQGCRPRDPAEKTRRPSSTQPRTSDRHPHKPQSVDRPPKLRSRVPGSNSPLQPDQSPPLAPPTRRATRERRAQLASTEGSPAAGTLRPGATGDPRGQVRESGGGDHRIPRHSRAARGHLTWSGCWARLRDRYSEWYTTAQATEPAAAAHPTP